MAPKSGPSATKRTAMLSWIQKSGVAHTLKDLEKALPSVGSISGMQVKEYIQAMLDENELTVEKIGAGNWYWSFPGAELAAREKRNNDALAEKERVNGLVEEVRERLVAARAAVREEDLTERNDLVRNKAAVEAEIKRMKAELDLYKESDPIEFERMRSETVGLKLDAVTLTDQIEDMSGWLRSQAGIDRETFSAMQREWFGDEFDEEEQGLRELK